MKRIMLKLSGEALAGEKRTGFDENTVRGVAFTGSTALPPSPDEIFQSKKVTP